MKRIQGFSLVELMVVVAIIGILVAIALPAFQAYTTRAKVTELLYGLSACKSSVTEYWTSQATWPATQAASGCSDQDSKYVTSLTVGPQGVITATAKTGPGAIDAAAAGNLELRPTVTAGGQLDWACNGVGTTIAAKYLPANCRP